VLVQVIIQASIHPLLLELPGVQRLIHDFRVRESQLLRLVLCQAAVFEDQAADGAVPDFSVAECLCDGVGAGVGVYVG
jgi:hypothetical protein